MPYPYDQVFAADPATPENVASNGVVTIFAPGDPDRTPLTITTLDGLPLSNPMQVNDAGFGPAFMHATLDQVAWSGGGFSGLFVSYKGMKDEAVAARKAAEAVVTEVQSPTDVVVDRGILRADIPGKVADQIANGPIMAGVVADYMKTPGSAPNVALKDTIKSETKDAYAPKVDVFPESFGVKNDGGDYSAQMQLALNEMMRVKGRLVLPNYTVRASGLVARGSFTISGSAPGTADLRLAGGSVLAPAKAGTWVLRIENGDGWRIENMSFRHDRSFNADGLYVGGMGFPNGNRWFDINHVNVLGFKGFGLMIHGTMWESKIDTLISRQNGDPAQDKAGIELLFPEGCDPDTLEFHNLNNVFPRYIGFRLFSDVRKESQTSSGLRGLTFRGGMWHAGFSDSDHTVRAPYPMGVLDGFTNLRIDGVNFASAAANQPLLELDGSAMLTGSKVAYIGANQWNGAIKLKNVRDIFIDRQTWPAWAPAPDIAEHIYVSSKAYRTTIKPQDVPGSSIYITDLGQRTVKPTDETLLIPAREFVSAGGTLPTFAFVESRWPSWLMSSTEREQINVAFQVPHEWRRFDMELVWASIGEATGKVKWQLGYSYRVPGDLLSGGDTFPVATIATAPTKGVLAMTTLATGVLADTIAQSGTVLWHARLIRVADDAADTLEATDAGVVGLQLRRTM